MAAVVTYSRYALKDEKELVMVRYKDVVNAPLTAGKTAEELIAAVEVAEGEEALPKVKELKSLKTRVCKDGEKFVVLASVRYIG